MQCQDARRGRLALLLLVIALHAILIPCALQDKIHIARSPATLILLQLPRASDVPTPPAPARPRRSATAKPPPASLTLLPASPAPGVAKPPPAIDWNAEAQREVADQAQLARSPIP